MADDYDLIVDKALLHLSYGFPASEQAERDAMPSLEQFAAGPIRDLIQWLARIARGEEVAPSSQVFSSVRALLSIVFWPRLLDDQQLRAFYRDNPLAHMLMRAKWQSVTAEDLLMIEAAGAHLHVASATIWQWIFTDLIEFVHDERTDRFFVLRSDVERIAAMQLPYEDAESPLFAGGPDDTRQSTSVAPSACANLSRFS